MIRLRATSFVTSLVELFVEPGGGRTRCLNLSYDLALCDGFREELNPSDGLQSERPPFANLGPSSVVFTIQLHGPDHLFRIRWLIADKLEWPCAVFQTPALGLIQSLDVLLFAPPKYQEWVLIPGSSSFNG
jgi:hypothetical protein